MATAATIRLTKRQRDMVEQHIPLIYYLADKQMPRAAAKGISRDDLRQEAVIAFARAVTRFNPYLGFKLTSYAGRCAQLELVKFISRYNPVFRVNRSAAPPVAVYADSEIGEDGGNTIWSMIGSEDDISHIFLQEILGELPPDEFRIVYDLLAGTPQKETAESLKCSPRSIANYKQQVFDKLRHHWPEYDDRAAQRTTAERPGEDNAVPPQRLPLQDSTPVAMGAT